MKKHLISIFLLIACLSCNSEKSTFEKTADKTEELAILDTLGSQKIIKTADMRFRVKDVQHTKENLSEAIKAERGTLVQFSIQSQIQRSEKVSYSTDSLLELTSYRTEGSVTASIPSDKLDEFTNKVAKMALFIDQQSLTLDDQSITYLTNKLKNQNRAEAVDQLNKQANKKSNNAETALNLKDTSIDNKIENMRIDNRVNYSTITLNFYQDNIVQKFVVENDKLEDYRPPFFDRFWLNIQNGWVVFMELILGIANLWMLILILITGYFIYKRLRRIRATSIN